MGRYEQLIPPNKDLLGMLRTRKGLECFTGSRVEHTDRGVQAERYVNLVANGHQPPGQLGGAGLGGPDIRVPLANGAFPQQLAVEGVPRHQPPIGRILYGSLRAFVQNREDPAAGGHHRADAAHVIVMP